MKTFKDFLTENLESTIEIQNLLNESELTEDQEIAIDRVVDAIMVEHRDGKDLDQIIGEILNEGILGSILGGLTGFALGKALGRAIARVLGVEKGALYDLFTSRLVGAAIGAVIGKRI
jgi:uncharacterized protein YcfJ